MYLKKRRADIERQKKDELLKQHKEEESKERANDELEMARRARIPERKSQTERIGDERQFRMPNDMKAYGWAIAERNDEAVVGTNAGVTVACTFQRKAGGQGCSRGRAEGDEE